jgi:hypothetical protein
MIRALALAFVLVLASCSHEPKPSALMTAEEAFDRLRAAVAREVKDPGRAKQASALVDELQQLVIQANADLKAHDARLWALNANYDATEADVQAAFRDFNAARDRRQDRTLELNRRAKALVTEDEWHALARAQERALRDAVEATMSP